MRVLLVHHGSLRDDDAAPVSGGALRARTHARAIRGAGHEVLTLGRAQDEADLPEAPWRRIPGFGSPGELRKLAQAASPDAILCVAPEEASALAGIAPLAVDLYAPRLLEGAFEGLQQEEAGRTLAAIDVADEVLFSNPRQRWFFLGLLGAAGWDLAAPAGRLVPLAAVSDGILGRGPTRPPQRPRGRAPLPVFVVGGQPWPWQDPRETLRRAVAHLAGRAEVVSVGLPAQEGVRALPRLPRAEWLAQLAGAVAVLDRYAPNPERQLALSFRQMDALAAGAPLISDADAPLAEGIRALGAGWVDEPLEAALDAALDGWTGRAPSRGSRALAERYAPERTETELLAWLAAPRARARGWSLLHAGARLARAEARAEASEGALEAARAEVLAKRAEVEALHGTIRALSGAVESSAAAVADVAAFRREAVAVLGTRLSGREAQAEHLARELEIARAEVDKKTRELEATQAERDRVGKLLRAIRG